ncbi:MAG: pyruvate, water dikinase [Acidimicrobiaceae bacterium]|nr:pyruvate, water dikinase [Acidimicrobiaceae bacterium]
MERSRQFRNPYDVETPPGAEGWESMYPSYMLFGEELRDRDEKKLWFFDQMHNPEPVYPFDLIMPESWLVSLNQYTTRVWNLPTALGIEQRIVNGYLYLSPNVIDDAAMVAQREPIFQERARYYFENWDDIYTTWVDKAKDCIERLKSMHFLELPDCEPAETVFQTKGTTSSFELLTSYSRLLENMHEMAYYHFEMLNLAYGAYLTFLEFCRAQFPAITDDLVARMVAGIDVILYRPDAELRRLAALAVDLGVGDALTAEGEPADAIATLGTTPAGKEWLAELEQVKDPWFYYSTGAGYCHANRAWIDDMRPPFAAMRDYVARVRRGEDLSRPIEHLQAERERIVDGYRDLLDDEEAAAFDSLLVLSRQVFPFVENHNFYVEHWHHSMFFDKVRELGAVLVAGGMLERDDDIFFLHRYEVYSVLYELQVNWSLGPGVPTRGELTWRTEIERRRRIYDGLRAWSAPPALGVPPERVTEPITVTLFGINAETIDRWLAAEQVGDSDNELKGLAASPGVGEGRARVVQSFDELDELVDGEILVCPLTAPSWSIVFARIAGAVSDGGGIMSHAAIVSREYELPAVVATGLGTKVIRTGDLVKVDGDVGIVTILERANDPAKAETFAAGASA